MHIIPMIFTEAIWPCVYTPHEQEKCQTFLCCDKILRNYYFVFWLHLHLGIMAVSFLGMDRISSSVSGIRQNPAIFQLYPVSSRIEDIKKPDIQFPNIWPDIQQTGYL